jgi:hypothetical protein
VAKEKRGERIYLAGLTASNLGRPEAEGEAHSGRVAGSPTRLHRPATENKAGISFRCMQLVRVDATDPDSVEAFEKEGFGCSGPARKKLAG